MSGYAVGYHNLFRDPRCVVALLDASLGDAAKPAANEYFGVTIVGAASATLGAATSTAAGLVEVHGAATVTLGAATETSSGTVTIAGAGAVALGAATSSAAGAVLVQGAATDTLGASTSSAAGTVYIQGAAAISLGDSTSVGAGVVPIQGATTSTLGEATGAGVVNVATAPTEGAADITLGAVTVERAYSQAENDYIGRAILSPTQVYAGAVADVAYLGAVASLESRNALDVTPYVGSAILSPWPATGRALLVAGAATSSAAGMVLIQGGLSQTLASPTIADVGIVGPVDGPFPVRRPLAVSDWTQPGLPAPAYWFTCQVASGNLTEFSGGTAMTARGGGEGYQASVAGWTAKHVTLTLSDGDNGWFHNVAQGVNPSATSLAILWYTTISKHPTLTRYLSTWATNSYLRFTGNGFPQLLCAGLGGAGNTGVVNHDDGLVHPILLVYNRTASTCRVFTDKEQVAATYASVSDGLKSFDANGGPSIGASCNLIAMWSGANAESLGKATLSTLGWPLSY